MDTLLSIGLPSLVLIVMGIIAFTLIKWVLSLRRVVAANEVHIVQSRNSKLSYGNDTNVGNVYYAWPSWIPVIGVVSITLPISVFDLDLENYAAYDKGRLPFVLDVKAFFRINDSNMAASRVESFKDLYEQLNGIVQGAVRTIMANADLEQIMSQRSIYGELFTKEIEEQLKQWGVIVVKNIELMDIRDARDSQVIQNIMEKKKSEIDMQSRTEVALNMQKALTAEIDAKREVDLVNEQARQLVGLRTAQVNQEIGIANEKAEQEIKEQAKITAERDMAVKMVNQVRAAEITKQEQVIKAEQDKEVTILRADADLQATTKNAEGIRLEGDAKAAADTAIRLAPVTAELELSKGIGEQQNYQDFIVRQKEVEAKEAIGVAQAQNLTGADIKIIVNSGDVQAGVSNVMDIFSPKGGTAIGGMVEALKQTDGGSDLINKFLGNGSK